MTNLERNPVSLIGSHNSCSCTLLADLPKEIAAGGSVRISAHIQVNENTAARETRGTIRIYTGHIRQPEIALNYILRGFREKKIGQGNMNAPVSLVAESVWK